MHKKVLLVDDSASTLMTEELILRQFTPYHCITAMDGIDAMVQAMKEAPDLVLMDAVMPRLSGFDACRTMRRERALRDVPIILVTATEDVQFMQAGLQCGCNDYITKPINSREFIAMLQKYLESNGTTPQPAKGHIAKS